MVDLIYHSNTIEGSTLTLRETQLILETGLTIVSVNHPSSTSSGALSNAA